jgi:hypothetical protein
LAPFLDKGLGIFVGFGLHGSNGEQAKTDFLTLLLIGNHHG